MQYLKKIKKQKRTITFFLYYNIFFKFLNNSLSAAKCKREKRTS